LITISESDFVGREKGGHEAARMLPILRQRSIADVVGAEISASVEAENRRGGIRRFSP
jgi:hypothetical protein